jgi:hypothetical protein
MDHQIYSKQVPRIPNAEELRELSQWIQNLGPDKVEADATVQSAFIAVYDHYITGGVGYSGKLMSVVWDGDPGFFQVFIWDDGKIENTPCDYR